MHALHNRADRMVREPFRNEFKIIGYFLSFNHVDLEIVHKFGSTDEVPLFVAVLL